ncbi:prephenate dehydrogenase/arogenate dehydrogenase family protein [Flexithrix dorotheae]|uniref:prephenate dehydrogenase/arogenate dehydrogenase family protein n=1 Tax=Flexithrix dorotheae TaxID=70993 RepID=UPI00037CE90D|nr:prephenate dehydrogenase/arogenate dehydrogenase family protein [Flexithrix dorotheae]
MKYKDLKVGVVGGSRGLGTWLVKFFSTHGFKTYSTSRTGKTDFDTNREMVEYCDIIIISVPISAMASVLEEVYPYMHGKILLEVCSVKKFVIDKYEALKEDYPEVACEFHSIHPMFSQRIKKLRGQVVLFNYSDGSNFFIPHLSKLLLKEGAVLYDLDYIKHDKIMGVVQGLNHFNVFVSARALKNVGSSLGRIKYFSSPPYRIFLIFFARYVLQDPRLYADIQMYNEFVLEVLKIFKEEVNNLFSIIERKDRDGFINYVEETRSYFEENQEDTGISNHLIEQLGIFISKQQAEKDIKS